MNIYFRGQFYERASYKTRFDFNKIWLLAILAFGVEFCYESATKHKEMRAVLPARSIQNEI